MKFYRIDVRLMFGIGEPRAMFRFVSLYNGTIGEYRFSYDEAVSDGETHRKCVEYVHGIVNKKEE